MNNYWILFFTLVLIGEVAWLIKMIIYCINEY